MKPIRVAFAGLAHSHPFTDATNLLALPDASMPVELVGVFDADEALLHSFTERFHCRAVDSLDALTKLAPDLVIVTARPHETVHFAEMLLRNTAAQLFFNKVVAANEQQLAAWEKAISVDPLRVGTASVLRFAPRLEELADAVAGADIWGIRVLAQHDLAMFLTEDRRWQDDPERGGGTLVTAGIHGWEMVGTTLPGAELTGDVAGWIHRSPDSRSRSEETAHLSGTLTLPAGTEVPFAMTVTGTPGPEVYAIDVFTSAGTHSVSLSFPNPSDSLGFRELTAKLISHTQRGVSAAPWASARTIVTNTTRAAQALREIHNTGKSQ